MRTKEKLAALLTGSGSEFISGSAIAEDLNISRAAVWKHIKALEKDGYKIEAVPNKGYRLSEDNDVVTEEAVLRYLGDLRDVFTVEVYTSVGSTNTLLKEKAGRLPDRSVIIAGAQTEGRGRIGRKFFSPEGTGIYLSVLLKQNIRPEHAGRLTTAAAVAACRAIEECTGSTAEIKWVNDVFVGGKKVCGILTEASVNYETGIPDNIAVGIGFNVYSPENGFPEDIAETAGAITEVRKKDLRARLAAVFLAGFHKACEDLDSPELYNEYKNRCFILGKPIYVLKKEGRIKAEAIDIRENFALLVRCEDGREEVLNAGEISIRPVK